MDIDLPTSATRSPGFSLIGARGTRQFEAAAGAARAKAGGKDRGGTRRRPRAWGRGGRRSGRSPALPGERPDWYGFAGGAGGARDGRDGHLRRSPAPGRSDGGADVGGEARGVEADRSPRPLPRWSLRSQRPHLLGRLVARDADAMIQAPASRSAHPRRPRSSASGPAPSRRSRPSPVTIPVTSTVLFGLVHGHRPGALGLAPRERQRRPRLREVGLRRGSVRRRRNGAVTCALDGPLSVAVTVLTPPFSSIDT